MGKITSVKNYVKKLTDKCISKFGTEFALDNEELIECAARNKRLLERFDAELDDSSLTVFAQGSTGQMKEDINPIIKHRNDVAKLYADNLDALMLTPRAKYKKADKTNRSDTDPINEYFSTINNNN